MLKTVSAIKVRQNLGQVMNEVSISSDDYIVERAGKPLVAIISVEKYLSMKKEREEFFRLYDQIQGKIQAGSGEEIDRDLDEAYQAARR